MLYRYLPFAVVAAIGAFSPAAAMPAGEAARLFGARENVSSIDISPDGRRLVYVAPLRGAASAAYVAEVGGTAPPKVILTSGGPGEALQSCTFASNTRLVCRMSGVVDTAGVLVGWSRLFSVADDGSSPKLLGQRDSFYDARIRQFDGEIVDWLPDEDGAVLMSRDYVPEAGKIGTNIVRRADGLGVDRIDLKTLKSKQVESPHRTATEYISDGHGRVRIMRTDDARTDTRVLTGHSGYHYRTKGSSEWRRFSEDDGNGMVPIAVDAESDTAYALKKLNGRNALYRVKLDGTLASELVFAHDRVDVDGVVRLGRGGRVIGVTYAEERRATVYFDPEFKKLQASLSKAIPHLPLVQFVSASADGAKLLIFAGSDSDPGRYYIFDKGSRQLAEVMLARPQLENAKLASVKPVSYPSSGGVSIPAYLTLPPDREAKGLPAVVLPHGGPSTRDEWGFDWLAQFLASQGYAVLQPNFRGSAGYGDPWFSQNGFQGWRTSIGDVAAGAKWLAQQGIADSKRTSIVGWSYGGYAALQAAATEPGLFSAAIAIAPVTDLALLKQQAEKYTTSRLVARFVGSGPHVKEGSPTENAARISAPVLMFHGDKDLNVYVEQSRAMDKALRGAGKKSELVVYPALDHDLVDSTARTDMLVRIADFLAAANARR